MKAKLACLKTPVATTIAEEDEEVGREDTDEDEDEEEKADWVESGTWSWQKNEIEPNIKSKTEKPQNNEKLKSNQTNGAK